MTTHQSPQQTTGTSGEGIPFSQLSFPDLYEQVLVGPLFQPWVEPLLEDVEFRSGDRVLDIACGTGIVARLVKQRLGSSGTVVGVDLNPQMLAVARQVAPMIDWREGDAAALPLRDGEQFDIVLCQQGYQFFPDQTAAAHQIHRALVKGGRLGVSTWCPDEEFPVLQRLRSVAEQHLGRISDRRHSLGDSSSLEARLREAGFHDIRSKRSARIIRFSDGFAFVRLNAMALISMSAASNSLSDEERQCLVADITRDSAQLVQLRTHESDFTYEIGTNVILARA
jgi:ubiquinone/menaquinone biosynthesis C-methylase UbiE